MIKYILFISIILTSCKTIDLQSQENISKKAIALYNEATELSFKGNKDDAIIKFKEAIEKEPKYYKALKSLSFLNQTYLKDFNKAIEYYKTIIEIEPNDLGAYYQKAVCEFKLKRYTDAKKSINSYLSEERIKGKYRLDGEQILKNINFSETANFSKNIIFKNLGSNINSNNKEYFPSLTPDNKFLYYTIKSNDIYTNEDIYYSENINGTWSSRKKISGTVNSSYNDGAHCISSSGKYLLFASENTKNGNLGKFDIFISKKTGENWKVPVNLGNKINSRYWDSQPVLSSNSKQLFFVSTRKGGYGGADIYISTIGKDGKFGEPKNIGDVINTAFDEQRPYLHTDGKTLYFSSGGHAGFGENDLFKSTLDENGNWSKPINLGYPINSSEAEFGIFVSSDGNKAYISSDRDGGYGSQDIYEFEMPENLKPEKVSYLKGIISDKQSKKPLKANIKIFDLESGEIFKTLSSDMLNGEFLTTIIAGKDYAFVAEAKKYLPFSENFSLKSLKENESFNFNVELDKIQIGSEINLNNIFFETNKYELLNNSKTELNYFINFLTENKNIKIEIGGHTDNVGSKDTNKILSEKRAKAVYEYLINNGISSIRITFKGFGDSKPIDTNETEKGRSKNRRTTFKIID